MTSDLPALVKAALLDLELAPLILADFLQENDREREAVLLRTRWKTWSNLKRLIIKYYNPDVWDDVNGYKRRLADNDASFRKYLKERFPQSTVEDVEFWFDRGGYSCAVLLVDSPSVFTVCGHSLFGRLSDHNRLKPRAICRKCRKLLTTLELKKEIA